MPLERFVEQFRQIAKDGLPYLVAVTSASPGVVVAYANAHGFRARSGGYKHTAEITLFCDHHHTGLGIGSRLLEALIKVVRDPSSHPELRVHGGIIPPQPINQIISVVALDEKAKKKGRTSIEFYEGFGFNHVGPMSKALPRSSPSSPSS